MAAAPLPGAYRPPLQVTLSCTDDAGACDAILYSTDGSAPAPGSSRYGPGPIVLAASATVRYVGRDRAGRLSAVGNTSYVEIGRASWRERVLRG